MRIVQPPITDVVRESKYVVPGDILQRGVGESERLSIGVPNNLLFVDENANALEYDTHHRLFQKARIVLRGDNQLILPDTVTKILYNNVTFDDALLWHVDQLRFILPDIGYYIVHMSTLFKMDVISREFKGIVSLNGVSYAENLIHKTSSEIEKFQLIVSTIIRTINPNEYVEFFMYHNSGASTPIEVFPNNTYVEIIGPF